MNDNGLTVGQLIDKLKDFDPDTPVGMYFAQGYWDIAEWVPLDDVRLFDPEKYPCLQQKKHVDLEMIIPTYDCSYDD